MDQQSPIVYGPITIVLRDVINKPFATYHVWQAPAVQELLTVENTETEVQTRYVVLGRQWQIIVVHGAVEQTCLLTVATPY